MLAISRSLSQITVLWPCPCVCKYIWKQGLTKSSLGVFCYILWKAWTNFLANSIFKDKAAHSLKLHGERGRGENDHMDNDHMDVWSARQSESKSLVKLARQRMLVNSLYCSCNFSMHLKAQQNKKLQKQMSALDSLQCKNLPLIKAYSISSFLRWHFFHLLTSLNWGWIFFFF